MPATTRRTSDRTVHAVYIDRRGVRTEIVRYNHAGQWYLEPAGERRRLVPIKKAVAVLVQAMEHPRSHARHFVGRYGGGQFDARMRREKNGVMR